MYGGPCRRAAFPTTPPAHGDHRRPTICSNATGERGAIFYPRKQALSARRRRRDALRTSKRKILCPTRNTFSYSALAQKSPATLPTKLHASPPRLLQRVVRSA